MNLSSVQTIVQNNSNQDTRDLPETDPATLLPHDIWKHILPHFNVEDCVKSSWISHKWKAIIDESGMIEEFFAPIRKIFPKNESESENEYKKVTNQLMPYILCSSKIADIMLYKKKLGNKEFCGMITEEQITGGIVSHVFLYGMRLSSWEKIIKLMRIWKRMTIDFNGLCATAIKILLHQNNLEKALYVFNHVTNPPPETIIENLITWYCENDRLEEAMAFYKSQITLISSGSPNCQQILEVLWDTYWKKEQWDYLNTILSLSSEACCSYILLSKILSDIINNKDNDKVREFFFNNVNFMHKAIGESLKNCISNALWKKLTATALDVYVHFSTNINQDYLRDLIDPLGQLVDPLGQLDQILIGLIKLNDQRSMLLVNVIIDIWPEQKEIFSDTLSFVIEHELPDECTRKIIDRCNPWIALTMVLTSRHTYRFFDHALNRCTSLSFDQLSYLLTFNLLDDILIKLINKLDTAEMSSYEKQKLTSITEKRSPKIQQLFREKCGSDKCLIM